MEEEGNVFGVRYFGRVFVGLWMFFGVVAFVWAIICFWRSGSPVDKILGLVIAFFFGPIYLIYLYYYRSYCRRK